MHGHTTERQPELNGSTDQVMTRRLGVDALSLTERRLGHWLPIRGLHIRVIFSGARATAYGRPLRHRSD